jgi:hypothetical protein
MRNILILITLALVGFFMLLPEPEKTLLAEASSVNNKTINHSFSEKASILKAGLITDFNQELQQNLEQPLMGGNFASTTDKVAGGNSVVKLAIVSNKEPSLDAKNTSLQISGELKPGFIYPWAGVSYLLSPELLSQELLSEEQQTAVNLSAIKLLEFSAKGELKSNKLSVLLFQAGSMQPTQQDIELTKEWQVYQIELSRFKNIDLTKVSNISFVQTKTLGKFSFVLDNLHFK